MNHQPQLPHGGEADSRDMVPEAVPTSWADAPAPRIDLGHADESQPGLLIEYWQIIRRRRGVLVLTALLGTAAGFLLSISQRQVYQARGSVEIQDLNEDFLNIKQVSPLSDSSSLRPLSDIETQIKILQSDSLLERVLAKLNRKESGDRAVETRRSESRSDASGVALATATSDDVLKATRRNLRVSQSGETRIVEVLYDSPSPAMAAEFVNTLVNEYIDQNVEARWQMSLRTGEWLTRQLGDMRSKLQRSEDSLQRYARQSGLVFTSRENNVSEDRLRQLQESLLKAQAERIARQSRFEMANNSAPETLPDVLNDISLRDYQSKLAELRRQRAELAITYSAEYSKVRKVEAQIASLESDLLRERAAIIKRIKNEYDEALQKERMLAVDYAAQTQQVTQEAEKSIQYNIMKREVDTNRQLYDAMLQRVKEANIASAMRASNVRVVDLARAPSRPYMPRTALNTLMGLLTGVFLGIAIILTRERADRSIRKPGDLNVYLRLPELGVIPSIGSKPHGLSQLIPVRRPQALPAAGQPPADGRLLAAPESRHGGHLEVATWQEPRSLVAESFRAVLTSILLSSRNGARPRTIVITSPCPSEGKSMIASNLAIALAATGQRVLLIDGDMWKPGLHKVFAVQNDAGFADLLGNAGGIQERLSELTHQTEVPGLFILPSGRHVPETANLLHSGAVSEVLGLASRMYDSVVIDSPPMLEFSDARVLGRCADGLIVVARVGATTREAAVAVRNRLLEDGVPVLGTILNDWDPRSSPDGYYGSYKDYGKTYEEYTSPGESSARVCRSWKPGALIERVHKLASLRPHNGKVAKPVQLATKDVKTTASDIRGIVEELTQIELGINETLSELGKLGAEEEMPEPSQSAGRESVA